MDNNKMINWSYKMSIVISVITLLSGPVLDAGREDLPESSTAQQEVDPKKENVYVASPIPTKWGESKDGLRCRVIVCQVVYEPHSTKLELELKVQIDNTSDNDIRIDIHDKGWSLPCTGVAMKESYDGDKEQNRDSSMGNDGEKRSERWIPSWNSMRLINVPDGDIVVAAHDHMEIEYAIEVNPIKVKRAMMGSPLRVYVCGQPVPGAVRWSGGIHSGEFRVIRHQRGPVR